MRFKFYDDIHGYLAWFSGFERSLYRALVITERSIYRAFVISSVRYSEVLLCPANCCTSPPLPINFYSSLKLGHLSFLPLLPSYQYQWMVAPLLLLAVHWRKNPSRWQRFLALVSASQCCHRRSGRGGGRGREGEF